MVDLTVLGISLQSEGTSPVLLLHPHGIRQILSLAIGPMEAFAISTALHAQDSGEETRGTFITVGAAGVNGQPRAEAHGSAPRHIGAGEREPDAPVFPGFSPKEESVATGVFPRPLTHDLMQHIMEALGGHLLRVDILRVENGTFFAEAVISTGNAALRLDCRPSDGVALALRCGALLRASQEVLTQAEDMVTVLEGLPDHVRTLAMAKIAASMVASAARSAGASPEAPAGASAEPFDFSRIPLVVEAALAAREKFAGEDSKKKLVTITGRVAPFGGQAPDPGEPPAVPAVLRRKGVRIILPQEDQENISSEPEGSPPAKEPGIRISLIRQTKTGEAEVLDEFQISANGIPHSVLDSMNPALVRLDENISEEERWAALLRILSPETKVLM